MEGALMVVLLVLASLAIVLGFACGIYAGTVTFFLFTDQAMAEAHVLADLKGRGGYVVGFPVGRDPHPPVRA